MHQPLAGLYVITPASETDPDKLIHQVELALRGGARLVQYRDKDADHVQKRNIAEGLLKLTRNYHALLIINDDVELAAVIGADGVHLGQDDVTLRVAREKLGVEAIIGASCYNRFELAQQASAQGADYVAFGRFFPSRTKPDAVQAELGLLQRAKRELEIPVAAIGGISIDNAQALIEAGSDMLAVVEGVFGQADIETAARHYQALLSSARHTQGGQKSPRVN